MANYHESGTICEATVRNCPLGVSKDEHIAAASKEEFEAKLAERFDPVASPTSKAKTTAAKEEFDFHRAKETITREWSSLSSIVSAELKRDGAQDLGHFPDSKPVQNLKRDLSKITGISSKDIARRRWEGLASQDRHAAAEAEAEAKELHLKAFGENIGAAETTLSYNLKIALRNAYLAKKRGSNSSSSMDRVEAVERLRDQMEELGELRISSTSNAHKFGLLNASNNVYSKADAIARYYQNEGTDEQRMLIARHRRETAQKLIKISRSSTEGARIQNESRLILAEQLLQ